MLSIMCYDCVVLPYDVAYRLRHTFISRAFRSLIPKSIRWLIPLSTGYSMGARAIEHMGGHSFSYIESTLLDR